MSSIGKNSRKEFLLKKSVGVSLKYYHHLLNRVIIGMIEQGQCAGGYPNGYVNRCGP